MSKKETFIPDKDLISMAKDLLQRYYELCREIDKDDVMSSSDLVMYEDDFQRYLDGEIDEENMPEIIENLRLFTAVGRDEEFRCPNCDTIRVSPYPVSDESGDEYCPDCNYTFEVRRCHLCKEPTVNKYCENTVCEVYQRDEDEADEGERLLAEKDLADELSSENKEQINNAKFGEKN